MNSIKHRLTLSLTMALVASAFVIFAGTYVFARAELRRIFDNELKQIAEAVHLREDWTEAGRVRVARPGFQYSVRAYDEAGRNYFETVQPALPVEVAQTTDPGLSFVDTPEGQWRLYTHVTPEGIVQVGQPVAARIALARDLSLLVFFPMLVLVAMLALAFSWVLKRGLAPLAETSRRVRERDATRLDPLATGDVPAELLPLVQQINALFGRVAESMENQRRFLADVAHELRSPVAALTLQLQQLERSKSPAGRAAALRELKGGIERVGRLVQQLLVFARLEPGTPSEPHRPVNISGLARAIVGGHAVQAEQYEVDLGVDAPLEAEVMGDESELHSLVTNLVDNALRHAPSKTAVTVSVRRNPGSVDLRVVDEGPGIPAVERERALRRFHRVRGDRTPGNGLGLSIVKAIVERHQGTLELADAHPEAERPGLEVRIGLPAAEDRTSSRQQFGPG